MKRTIAVVTSSRADYSHLYWLLRDLAAHPAIELKIITLGPHLSPEFGSSAKQIERDGFNIDARIECLLSSDTDVGMAKTIGVAVLGLADCLARMRPDLMLVIADRYEMLAPASVALALRIPLAHIEGGEISEGAIDDSVRNALTKLSHIHFTSTETARARVIGMGEAPWRVHCAGAPSLDHLRRAKLLTLAETAARLGLDPARAPVLATLHPVTMARDTTREADAFFDALAAVEGPIVFCYPNADAGSRELMERSTDFSLRREGSAIFVNLEPPLYWSLLHCSDLLIGNSSSGIMEAASFGVPAVNVGIRQRGREYGPNVLQAEASKEAILKCVDLARDKRFRASLAGMRNPYGDGRASARIVEVLASVETGEDLLIKKTEPVRRAGDQ